MTEAEQKHIYNRTAMIRNHLENTKASMKTLREELCSTDINEIFELLLDGDPQGTKILFEILKKLKTEVTNIDSLIQYCKRWVEEGALALPEYRSRLREVNEDEAQEATENFYRNIRQYQA